MKNGAVVHVNYAKSPGGTGLDVTEYVLEGGEKVVLREGHVENSYLLTFRAFNCAACPGIMLLWGGCKHYCEDCGGELQDLGPISQRTFELLVSAATWESLKDR